MSDYETKTNPKYPGPLPDRIRDWADGEVALDKYTSTERERCLKIIWENRNKFLSNASCLALMTAINGEVMG